MVLLSTSSFAIRLTSAVMANSTTVPFSFSPLEGYDYSTLEAADVSHLQYSTLEPVVEHRIVEREKVDIQLDHTGNVVISKRLGKV